MHFPTRVRTWRVAPLVYSVLYSEIALPRKPFEWGTCTYTLFLLRMIDYYDLPEY
jgi:hypothetical protein